jgi:hypothetical protein
MSVETASYREQFLFTYVVPTPCGYAGCRGLAGLSGECHKLWLPSPAKGTDLLPALRTNPLVEVSLGMDSLRKK